VVSEGEVAETMISEREMIEMVFFENISHIFQDSSPIINKLIARSSKKNTVAKYRKENQPEKQLKKSLS
jgi:hypothetical protein